MCDAEHIRGRVLRCRAVLGIGPKVFLSWVRFMVIGDIVDVDGVSELRVVVQCGQFCRWSI